MGRTYRLVIAMSTPHEDLVITPRLCLFDSESASEEVVKSWSSKILLALVVEVY